MLAIPISHGASQVNTLASGTAFVELTSAQCNEILIINDTGVAIDIMPFGATANTGNPTTGFITIPANFGTPVVLPVCQNAQEYAVRRNDKSATPVTVKFNWVRWVK
jgi:hypothetical protein